MVEDRRFLTKRERICGNASLEKKKMHASLKRVAPLLVVLSLALGASTSARADATIDLLWNPPFSSEVDASPGENLTLEIYITAGVTRVDSFAFTVDYSAILGEAVVVGFTNTADVGGGIPIFPLTIGLTEDDGTQIVNFNGGSLPEAFLGTGLASGQEFLVGTIEFHVVSPLSNGDDLVPLVRPATIEGIIGQGGIPITATSIFNGAALNSGEPPVSEPTLTKTDALLVDDDGDNMVDPGDTVRYTISVSNGSDEHTSVVVTDAPDANSTLVDGSVTTTLGSVTTGNGAGDASVEVDLGTLSPNANATITFDVVVNSPFPLGENQISNQAELTGDALGPIASDDPDSAAEGDATLTPIVDVDIDICESELETCEGELGTCTSELSTAQGELSTCQGNLGTCSTNLDACLQDPPFEDADGDGEHDDTDTCPGTPAAEPVDAAGCSLAQFCAGFDVSGTRRNSPCNQADWGNDEPLGAEDCKARDGVCEPR
jgi:uncharacterized repeat protein (TIGR01451 family)